MSNKIYCEKCGSEMQNFREDHTCGTICPNCGWSCVTSYFSAIELDQTLYTIHIQKTPAPSLTMIRCVAKLIACNFITARSLLENGTAAYEGRAVDIRRAAESLKAASLSYSVTPDFPY